ncbi:carbohydrate ABC transporter permease [Paenibacillus sp. J2TS4]|uniref:carbohydrate ABC transporter permease n=1 Tax=Paenibacillus sp. J2TS4 TaxID=2807194 RepID=UPI001AFD9B83|nr:carbohydrate ABC transporter permease [Paenibacillus sp. J2TS4]GIP35397.1 sugar ABC transporter permease [Paenibacillus sp. J2TS4]
MIKPSLGDRIFAITIYIVLSLILLIVIYPLIFVLSASISNPEYLLRGEIWLLPKDITFDGYVKVFQNKDILNGYKNTIMYTVLGTAINLLLTVMAAYPLSRNDFYGRNYITALMVFTMFFSGGMIPMYLLIKDLHMLNTIWALLLPGAVSVYNVIIMRTFFQTSIPNEIQEAAAIDGCSNIQTLLRIVLPLSAPIIAVMVLFYAVGHWNAFFNALIYLTDRDKYPLQIILREILIQENMDEMTSRIDEDIIKHMMQVEGLKYAVVVVANLPVLLLYPFLQKYFVKGVMIGALKG